MIYELAAESNIVLVQSASVINGKYLPYYGSVQDADNYFDFRLHTQAWDRSSRTRKVKALADASRRIDQLNFVGDRLDSAQFLQFPRVGQDAVPTAILQAVYELALVLLSGVDPDTEANNLSSTSRAFGGLRTDYDRSWVHQNIRSGIPSQTAWNLLLPWLRPVDTIELSRSS